MVIRKVEVENYRSVRNATLECEGLTAIVGKNGAGKSSFLSALDKFYNPNAQFSVEDFYARQTTDPIVIRVTYGELGEAEVEEFGYYVVGDELAVTKRITERNGRLEQKYFAAGRQVPEFARIRSLTAGQRDSFNELVRTERFEGLQRARNAGDALEKMDAYEGEHPKLLELVEREEQFFGPANVGGGKLDKYTRFVLVPAVREASAEIERKGAIAELFETIVSRKVRRRTDVRKFIKEFETRAVEVFSAANLTELPEMGTEISKVLGQFWPGALLNLKWGEAAIPQIQLPSAIATLVEDGFEGDVGRKGHGLQRALVLTLLQYLAASNPVQTQDDEEDEDEAGQGERAPVEEKGTSEESVGVGPDLIIGIEEPELYLHPSKCRFLAQVLLRLATDSGLGVGERNQVIYTTHSPYFVDLDRFESIRIAGKVKGDGPFPCTKITGYCRQDACVRLAEVCEREVDTLTPESFRAHAAGTMNVVVNEGFFGSVVLVVEGVSDAAGFWELQGLMHENWAGAGIVVVPAGGKNNLDRPVVVFEGFGIPTYFVFDGDRRHQGKRGEKDAVTRNRRYLRLAGQEVAEFPDTRVEATWAVLAEDMETAVREGVPEEEWLRWVQEVCSEYGYHDCAAALKSPVGMAQIVRRAYQPGRMSTLESIVRKVSLLAPFGRAANVEDGGEVLSVERS